MSTLLIQIRMIATDEWGIQKCHVTKQCTPSCGGAFFTLYRITRRSRVIASVRLDHRIDDCCYVTRQNVRFRYSSSRNPFFMLKKARWFQISALTILTLGIAIVWTGCAERKRFLDHENFGGYITWSDGDYAIVVKNESDHDLEDVNITLTFFGYNGDRYSSKQNWTRWRHGEVKILVARDSRGLAVKSLIGATGEGSSAEHLFRFGAYPADEL